MPEIEKRLPKDIRESQTIPRYIEPFIGGGALFFLLKNKYTVKNAYILDINCELIAAYRTVRQEPEKLLEQLTQLQKIYLNKTEEARETYYYEIRDLFNRHSEESVPQKIDEVWIERTAQLIFLNKTCYNGLFRKNRAGGFNVPFGRYKKPTICDEPNIREVHHALENTEIIQGDFTQSKKFVKKDTFIYLDPPYRPLSKTASFTGYTGNGFSDEDQKRLFQYYHDMAKKGARLLLSNSDPRNLDRDDDFFDKLYEQFHIERVEATRMINCNGSRRGKINEILVTGNYDF